MSATAPASTTPPLPPALPKAPQRKPGSPIAGFLIDLGIATLSLLALSMASGLLWGLYRAVIVVRDTGAQAAEALASRWANLARSRRS
jgi:hypothetical protein